MTKKTEVEKAIAKGFSSFLEKCNRSGRENASVIARKVAMDAFLQNGLPSRKKERWHYTDLRGLLFSIPSIEDRGDFLSKNHTSYTALVSGSVVLSVVSKKRQVTYIPGIKIIPFPLCLEDEEMEFPKSFSDDDSIGQINTALFDCGFRIVIAENKNVSQVIELQNLHLRRDPLQRHVHFSIYVKKGARVTFIERQASIIEGEGGREETAFVSSVSTLEIEEEAKVVWIIVRDRPVDSTELNQFRAQLRKKAVLELYSINVGTGLLRQEIYADLVEQEATFKTRGINLLSGKSHTDITLNVCHKAEKTVSSQIIRNVVTGKALGIFQGNVIVTREAQKTNSAMGCNSLILSDEAEFNTKPALEIFADEVSCSHGATVAEINRLHLFYLMARGIPKAQAQAILIKAFVEEQILQLSESTIKNCLQKVLKQWLIKYQA